MPSQRKGKTTSRNVMSEPFRLMVEGAPNAMVMVDEEGKIVIVNAQTEKLFGYPREELIGRTIEILVPPRSKAVHADYRRDFQARPQTRAMGAGRDLFGLRKDGSEVPVEIGLNPIKDGGRRFIMASIVDITERKRLERRLAQSEALASIGGMVAVVAHEIRNPLGSIVMAAKNLSRGDLEPEEHAQVMSVLVKESQRLNGTLDDFLQFARPRELKLEKADLNEVTKEVLSAVRSDEGLAGRTRVELSLGQGVPPFAFDVDQIRRVLWNLIRNAFQALDGKGRLRIKTETVRDEAFVHVQDDGPGLSPAQLEKLFTPFHTTKAKGTGLGLPIARNIVLAHGGDIRVESAVGKGSRFSVVLPLTKR